VCHCGRTVEFLFLTHISPGLDKGQRWHGNQLEKQDFGAFRLGIFMKAKINTQKKMKSYSTHLHGPAPCVIHH
jgi:hypothetical protein